MKYIIHAMESSYRGKCGIEEWGIVNMIDIEAVKNYAYSICNQLIQKYTANDKNIQKAISNLVKKQHYSPDAAREKVYKDYSYFLIYELNDAMFSSGVEMSREFRKDKKDFVNKYCRLIYDSCAGVM